MRIDEIIPILFFLGIMGTVFLAFLVPTLILWLVLIPTDFWGKLAVIVIGSLIGAPVAVFIFLVWSVLLGD